MSIIGEKSTINSSIYCTIPSIAMQGYHTNREDTGARVATQFVTLHLGSDGCQVSQGDSQVYIIDVDVILEKHYVDCKYKKPHAPRPSEHPLVKTKQRLVEQNSNKHGPSRFNFVHHNFYL